MKHFKGFRNSIIDGDYKADELSLGILWAVVQLCWLRRRESGDKAGMAEVLITVLG